jgi:hypothetical protein
MRIDIGIVLLIVGLLPVVLWFPWRLMKSLGVFGWQVGRSVTHDVARTLDAKATAQVDSATARLRGFILPGAILAVAGIVVLAV